MLFELLTAANFMGIKELLDLTCLKVTFLVTGKNAEEIRQIFRLPKLIRKPRLVRSTDGSLRKTK